MIKERLQSGSASERFAAAYIIDQKVDESAAQGVFEAAKGEGHVAAQAASALGKMSSDKARILAKELLESGPIKSACQVAGQWGKLDRAKGRQALATVEARLRKLPKDEQKEGEQYIELARKLFEN